MDGVVTTPDGRHVGYRDFGGTGLAVVECHGGPGSRFEAAAMAAQPEAVDAGVRVIGVDRPGYGLSDPQPGRSIASWVVDALAVLDALSIPAAAFVGVSTGASYAMAVAALAPTRTVAAMSVCGMADMSWAEGKAMVEGQLADMWAARTRDEAIATALRYWGEDGSRAGTDPDGAPAPPLCDADMALFADPAFLVPMLEAMPHMWAHGVQGYADDRLADGRGWVDFDVADITCPVLVLQGDADTIVPVAWAEHTASTVPGARLDVRPGLGHFSITPHAIPALLRML